MPMIVVTLKMDKDMLDTINKVAKEKRITRSELIRAAIRKYLESENCRRPIKTKRIVIY